MAPQKRIRTRMLDDDEIVHKVRRTNLGHQRRRPLTSVPPIRMWRHLNYSTDKADREGQSRADTNKKTLRRRLKMIECQLRIRAALQRGPCTNHLRKLLAKSTMGGDRFGQRVYLVFASLFVLIVATKNTTELILGAYMGSQFPEAHLKTLSKVWRVFGLCMSLSVNLH